MTTGAASKGVVRRVFSNPWVTLAIGAAAGYLGYKYRKEIIAAARRATDAGKDFVLEQRERLSDLVAEADEAEDNGKGES